MEVMAENPLLKDHCTKSLRESLRNTAQITAWGHDETQFRFGVNLLLFH